MTIRPSGKFFYILTDYEHIMAHIFDLKRRSFTRSEILGDLANLGPHCEMVSDAFGRRYGSGGYPLTAASLKPSSSPQGGCSSVVERQLPKLYVAGSIPATRSNT